MATFRMSIMGALAPDSTGNAFFEPYAIKASNDTFQHLVAILNDAASDCGFYGTFNVPKNYVGTAKIIPVWTSTATSGNAEFGFAYRAIGGDDAESLDQASFQEGPLYVQDAAPSASHERNTPSISLTSANLAADDTVEFYFFRDNNSTGGADDMAAAVILHDLIFEYADA